MPSVAYGLGVWVGLGLGLGLTHREFPVFSPDRETSRTPGSLSHPRLGSTILALARRRWLLV